MPSAPLAVFFSLKQFGGMGVLHLQGRGINRQLGIGLCGTRLVIDDDDYGEPACYCIALQILSSKSIKSKGRCCEHYEVDEMGWMGQIVPLRLLRLLEHLRC